MKPLARLLAIVLLFCATVPTATAVAEHGKAKQHHAKKAKKSKKAKKVKKAKRHAKTRAAETTVGDPGTTVGDPGTTVGDPGTTVPAEPEGKNPAKTCKAEEAKDPAAFADKYGTNHNKKNAFGKCVSAHAHG